MQNTASKCAKANEVLCPSYAGESLSLYIKKQWIAKYSSQPKGNSSALLGGYSGGSSWSPGWFPACLGCIGKKIQKAAEEETDCNRNEINISINQTLSGNLYLPLLELG